MKSKGGRRSLLDVSCQLRVHDSQPLTHLWSALELCLARVLEVDSHLAPFKSGWALVDHPGAIETVDLKVGDREA